MLKMFHLKIVTYCTFIPKLMLVYYKACFSAKVPWYFVSQMDELSLNVVIKLATNFQQVHQHPHPHTCTK